jgi:hypothetical protein
MNMTRGVPPPHPLTHTGPWTVPAPRDGKASDPPAPAERRGRGTPAPDVAMEPERHGHRIPIIDLQAGDRVHLAHLPDDGSPMSWSAPVTITSVLLIDSELAQVRWAAEAGQDPWGAHLLLLGPAYRAGAIPALG